MKNFFRISKGEDGSKRLDLLKRAASRIKRDQKTTGSLKTKLISGFVVMGLVIGIASVVSNFILGKSIDKLGNMMETTVLANGIVNSLNELVDVQGALTQYATFKDDENLEKINGSTKSVKNNVLLLKTFVEDKTSSSKLSEIEGQIATCMELIDGVVDAAKKQDSALSIEKKDEAGKIIGFIKIEIENFIASELNYQEIKKAELKKQAAVTKTVVVIVILIAS